MNGGASEYMMANIDRWSGPNYMNSGYVGSSGGTRVWPESKYYDLYTEGSSWKKGNAGEETYDWYGDSDTGNSYNSPWIERGLLTGSTGDWGAEKISGIFSIEYGSGVESQSASFRIVLTPNL